MKKVLSVILSLIIISGVVPTILFTANAVENPVFEIVKTEQNRNNITVAVNLVKGTFNAMDFQFIMSDGVKCESISASDGVGNCENGCVALVSVDGFSSGTVITASFTVPLNELFSVSGIVSHCYITKDKVNYELNAAVDGSVSDILNYSKCGENVYYTLDESTGLLTIFGTGDMWDYDYNNDYYELNPFQELTRVNNIVIENGITHIGDFSFFNLPVQNVSIPESVISIGKYAFCGCMEMKNITIPENVEVIGEHALFMTGVEELNYNAASAIIYPAWWFYSCAQNLKVTIGESVKTIPEYFMAYNGCYDEVFNDIDFFAFDSRRYDNIFNDIQRCQGGGLKEIYIPDNVESIGNSAFLACNMLTDVYISNNVADIANCVFEYCTNLVNIKIPDSVTSIGYDAFAQCASLTSIEIPAGVKSIGDGAFFYCENLTNVTIHDGVTSIGYSAFSTCISLTDITIPASVTSIDDLAFAFCISLSSINVDENNEFYYSDEYGVLYSKSKTELIEYPSGNKRREFSIPDGVTSIDEWAFDTCLEITNIIIPDDVTSIGGWAFRQCVNLTSITIPNSVSEIGEAAFLGCDSLTDVYYNGTKEEWNSIEIKGYNEDLLNATIHFIEEPHTHTYSHISIPVTCTSDGVEYDICTECDDVINLKTVTASGHNWSGWTVTKEPTAKEEGCEERECSLCHIKETRTVEKLSTLSVKLQESMELKYKETGKINTLIYNPDNIENTATYESSDSGVAMVDNNGNVYASGRGTATITCTVTDEYGNVVKDTCTVTVKFSFGQWLIWILLLGFLWY